jgi:hypothetical protein
VEADLARAELRAAQASGEASRAEGLAHENGELRSMVMALLEVVEGRQKSSLASVMQHLEESVSALLAPAGGAWTADIKDGAGNNEIATETILMPDPSGTEATGMEGEPDAEPGPEKHGGFEIDADVMVDEEPAAGMDPDGSVVVEPGAG